MTIDDLIRALEVQKAAGIAGTTPVGIPALDNNGRAGMLKLDATPHIAAMAKNEHEKGWMLCRVVSRGGVPVLVIA